MVAAELFDLKRDIGETTDLAASKPELGEFMGPVPEK